ncbi:MAG TPA: HEAT repeat domain-containing protein [Kofleriaceae bacterium]|nr:HEAT repeat domain-containing protein [Kofleriaceae bacterium]
MKRGIVAAVLAAALGAVLVLARQPAHREQAPVHARTLTPIEHASEAGNVEYLAATVRAEGPSAAHAAAAIARIDDTAAAPALTAIARDLQAPVLLRANAIHALAACDGDGALLLELATNDREPMRVRQEAALALRSRGTPTAVAPLATALDHEPDEQMRISLIQALKAIDSADARAAVAHHAQRQLSATERAFVVAKS